MQIRKFGIQILGCFVLLLHSLLLTAQTINYGDNPSAAKYITLNGARHYYEVYGEGSPILLIHGNGTPIRGWAPQIDYFSKKYKVYAIDSRGRGKSELGKDSLTYVQQAVDMAAFIKELHLDSVMVVGKSDGGIIAILMGIYYPAHLKKIVSFSANMWPDSTALYGHVVAEQYKERVHAEQMFAVKGHHTKLVSGAAALSYDGVPATHHRCRSPEIDVPVLVMSCDRDVIKEEHTFFIYRNIRKANLCIVPGERHGIARENPQLFNLLVDKYLSEPFRELPYRF